MNATPTTLQRSGHLRRVDTQLANWVARAFPDVAADTVLAAALAARAVADGHSALALDQVPTWIAGLAEGHAPALPETSAWQETLRRSPAVQVHSGNASTTLRPLVLDPQGRIYLRRYFEYEQQLAHTLADRALSSPLPQTDSSFGGEAARSAERAALARGHANKSNDGNPAALDPEQHRAIATALAHRFTLITGGPGSGKTHSVARILAALTQQAHARGEALRIALAAPTGKAAARLGESLRAQLGKFELPEAISTHIPRDAQTVHSLLGVSPWRPQPRFDRATPLAHDVVVVDEVSMVDLPLMAKLVDAVSPSARLILLGDPDQLSAVEAGNVLGALVEAAADGPLQNCHVALRHSHRFGADSALGTLAAAIARGDAEASLRTFDQTGEVTLADSMRSSQLVETLAAEYQPILAADGPAAALRAAHGFRVLTALRHGPSGCLALDRAIGARLQRAAGVRGDVQAWRGRLILMTANRPEFGLFNGDTGVLWPGTDGTLQAWFDGGDGAPRALSIAALPPHEGAFALTVHKAQGSEYARVALVAGPDSAVLTRELLYTGVTRARAGVTLYGTAEVLRAGIGRRTLRMTGLADRLREAADAAGT